MTRVPGQRRIDIVIADRLAGRKAIVTGGGAKAEEFVGGRAGAGAAAANWHGPLRSPGADRPGDGTGVVRVIHRIGGVGSQVDDLVAGLAKFLDDPQFQRISGMIRARGYLHRNP